jgi:hypothetical protein
MFGKKQRLTREEENKLFALSDLIDRSANPDRPTSTHHPVRIWKGIGSPPVSDEEQDVIDVQNKIKRLLGI